MSLLVILIPSGTQEDFLFSLFFAVGKKSKEEGDKRRKG